VLGFGFGAVKGTVIVVLAFSVLVLAYDTIWGPDGRPAWIRHSRSYSFINASSEALVKMISKRRREAAEAAASENADGGDDASEDAPAPAATRAASHKSGRSGHHRAD
ncbi:MAG TPA: CvpA family protein, partial [Novosphingobium sp.]|nr:CvpA family protein [Novosphingobium sp.]